MSVLSQVLKTHSGGGERGGRWLPVVGYEGAYEVSDDGRVYSVPRKGKRFGQFLKVQLNPRVRAS